MGDKKNLAMAALLASETKALQTIERLKLTAQKEVTDEKTQGILELMSEPHKWQLANGTITQVESLIYNLYLLSDIVY